MRITLGGIILNIFDWIVSELSPRPVCSDQLFYDELESQSGESLPIVYRPFDVNDRSHWDDRGSILDFIESTGGGRVLDKPQELWAFEDSRGTTRLVLYDRCLSEERVVHYGLSINAPLRQTTALLGLTKDTYLGIPPVDALERIRPLIDAALTCTLFHPGCRTWKTLLAEAGFNRAEATHAGGPAAAHLYDAIPENQRPAALKELDRYLRPIIRAVTSLAAPDDLQMPITAFR